MPKLQQRLIALRVDVARSFKPRDAGITMMLDAGIGPGQAADVAAIAGPWCDYVKLAWGSALISHGLTEKLEIYRRADILPLFGGTLFEYAYVHGRIDEFLAMAKDLEIHVEVSDGVASIPRRDKLHWIERFAACVDVFSEVGGKTHRISGDWKTLIREELEAGAKKIVVEGREIGPPGEPLREDLVDELLVAVKPSTLIFEALERSQQVWFIKKLGPNVNLGNIRPNDLMTVEAFRHGLKEHTLLHASTWRVDS